jgi:hypothetical protein
MVVGLELAVRLLGAAEKYGRDGGAEEEHPGAKVACSPGPLTPSPSPSRGEGRKTIYVLIGEGGLSERVHRPFREGRGDSLRCGARANQNIVREFSTNCPSMV